MQKTEAKSQIDRALVHAEIGHFLCTLTLKRQRAAAQWVGLGSAFLSTAGAATVASGVGGWVPVVTTGLAALCSSYLLVFKPGEKAVRAQVDSTRQGNLIDDMTSVRALLEIDRIDPDDAYLRCIELQTEANKQGDVEDPNPKDLERAGAEVNKRHGLDQADGE